MPFELVSVEQFIQPFNAIENTTGTTIYEFKRGGDMIVLVEATLQPPAGHVMPKVMNGRITAGMVTESRPLLCGYLGTTQQFLFGINWTGRFPFPSTFSRPAVGGAVSNGGTARVVGLILSGTYEIWRNTDD